MTEFSHAKVLFLHEDGSPMHFYMVPSSRRNRLRPYIEHGGGKISNRNITDLTVKLAQPGVEVISDDYVDSKYILDCVTQNKQLDIRKYRLKKGRLCPDSEDEWEEEINAQRITGGVERQTSNNEKFTKEMDLAILRFLLDKQSASIHSRRLWNKLETEKVTPRTAGEMQYHYRTHILPHLHKYQLKPDEVQFLKAAAASKKTSDTEDKGREKVQTKIIGSLRKVPQAEQRNRQDANNDQDGAQSPKSASPELMDAQVLDDLDEFVLNYATQTAESDKNKNSVVKNPPGKRPNDNGNVNSPRKLTLRRRTSPVKQATDNAQSTRAVQETATDTRRSSPRRLASKRLRAHSSTDDTGPEQSDGVREIEVMEIDAEHVPSTSEEDVFNPKSKPTNEAYSNLSPLETKQAQVIEQIAKTCNVSPALVLLALHKTSGNFKAAMCYLTNGTLPKGTTSWQREDPSLH